MSNTVSAAIDISLLPEHYREEIVDYYQILLEKYKKNKWNSGTAILGTLDERLLPRTIKSFIPMDGEEIYE